MSMDWGGQITIGLDRPGRMSGGQHVRHSEVYTLDLSDFKGLRGRQMKRILADHRKLAEVLEKHPDEVAEIADDVLHQRREAASKKGRKLGLTEEEFEKEGGGFWGVVLFVALLLLSGMGDPAH